MDLMPKNSGLFQRVPPPKCSHVAMDRVFNAGDSMLGWPIMCKVIVIGAEWRRKYRGNREQIQWEAKTCWPVHLVLLLFLPVITSPSLMWRLAANTVIEDGTGIQCH
jgi:hypothetical protein